jgi:hypothetical protein
MERNCAVVSFVSWCYKSWQDTWVERAGVSLLCLSLFTIVINPVLCDVINKALFGVLIPEMHRWLLVVYAPGAIETPFG